MSATPIKSRRGSLKRIETLSGHRFLILTTYVQINTLLPTLN